MRDGSEVVEALTTELEVTRESTSLQDGVRAVESEVEVGLRVSRDEGRSKHLGELLNVGRESGYTFGLRRSVSAESESSRRNQRTRKRQ